MFIINMTVGFYIQNNPKYLITSNYTNTYDFTAYDFIINSHKKSFRSRGFCYYLIVANYMEIQTIKYTKFKMPKYLITSSLHFNLKSSTEKFNLDKLGTDYIANKITALNKNECIGSYPDNYVFVIEPDWPLMSKNSKDRTPLKKY